LKRFIFSLIILQLISNSNILNAQELNQKEELDSIVNSSINISEQYLFNADFEEAGKYLNLEYFKGFKNFSSFHHISLITQISKIQLIRNTVYQKTSENKIIHQNILDLLPLIINLEEGSVYGNYLFRLGSAYLNNSERQKGISYYEKALKVVTEAGDLKSAAGIRVTTILMKLNKYRETKDKENITSLIPEFEQEIQFSLESGNQIAYAYNTRHLGSLYLNDLKNYQKAYELYDKSLKIREEIGFKPYLPASYSSIADLLVHLKDDDKAIEMYHKSIDLAEKIGFVRYQFHPRIKLGDIYKKKNDLKKAQDYYKEALKSASKNQYLSGIDEALKKLDDLKNNNIP